MPDMWFDVDTAIAEAPVNIMPLIDDTDFKSIEDAVAYNATGLTLHWHFVTSAGAYSVTAVTPTTGGDYDWTDQGTAGIYTIEIPASGGASINNDTEGYGWFTGKATGVLPWRGPVIGFRAAAINDSLCDTNTTGLLAPTTAGRTLDVSAGGEAGVDWANVGSPTTTLNLSGTTVKTATDVETDTADIQARLPAALVSGRIDASVGAMAANVLTAAAINAAALNGKGDWNIGKTGYSLTAGTGLGNQTADITGNLSGSVGSVSGNVTGSVGSVAAGGITAASIATDAIDGDAIAASAVTEIQSGLATASALQTVDDNVDAILADTGTDGVVLSTATKESISDTLLARDIGSGSNALTATNERTVRSALRFLRNKWSIATGTLTVTTENDTTTAWTSALTTSETAQAVTDSNPT